MKYNPVFSIITPTFQRASLLRRALLSVQCQSFSDFEHIIIDDSNNPENDAIIKEFQDERIILHKHPHQRGAAAGYNSGLRISRGEYILFLDDDDEYLPSFLNTVYNFLISHGEKIGFVWTGIALIKDTDNEENELLSKVWPYKFPDRQSELIAATTIGNGYGLCIKKECFSRIGFFNESILMGHDADLMFRLVRYYDFRTIPKVLVRIHIHGNNQLTQKANNPLRLELRERILSSNKDLIDSYPKLYRVHFRHIAEMSYSIGLNSRGRRAILGILRRLPLSLTDYLNLLTYEVCGKDFVDTFYLRKLKKFIVSLIK